MKVLAVLVLTLPAAAQGAHEILEIESPETHANSFASAIDLSGDTLIVGSWNISLNGSATGAAYIYERDLGGPGVWGHVRRLTVPMPFLNEYFGWAVAIEGDTIAIGAPSVDHSGLNQAGAVYIFERNLGGPEAWGQRIELTASNAQSVAFYGTSVALSGDTLVVGADEQVHSGFAEAGAVYVYERDLGGANAWGEAKQIVSSTPADRDWFGSELDVDGDTLMVHSRYGGVRGGVHVFERDHGGIGAWGELPRLAPSDEEERSSFGLSISLSGDTALIGALGNSAVTNGGDGRAYVFERSETTSTWAETHILSGAEQQPDDLFGLKVALQGDRALVSALYDDVGGIQDAGSIYVFDRNQESAGSWGQLAHLTAASPLFEGYLGASLALEGETAMVGASGPHTVFVFGTEFTLSERYCTAGTSASGCQAFVTAVGLASASAPSGFTLSVANMEGAKDGLFFYGTNGRQANPWGSGTSYVCVIPPRVRGGLLTAAGSTAGACDGFHSQDLNARWCSTCPKPLHNPGAGAVMQAQFWYRDPLNTSNQTSSMSDAIEFTVGP